MIYAGKRIVRITSVVKNGLYADIPGAKSNKPMRERIGLFIVKKKKSRGEGGTSSEGYLRIT